MEHDSWSFGGLSAASSRSTTYHHQSMLRSQSDLSIEFDDFDGDDEELRLDFPCPFCSEDFDLVGLCRHIDEEHPSEPNYGICPVCITRVVDMVGHITIQHVSMLKFEDHILDSLTRAYGQHKLKPHKGDYSTLSFSRKELQDADFRSIFGSLPSPVSTSKMALDPLLSFLHRAPASDKSDDHLQSTSAEVVLEDKSSEKTSLKRNSRPPPLSDKDQEEKEQRCKFVQGLLWSTIMDDDL